jgi:hypothetical protein
MPLIAPRERRKKIKMQVELVEDIELKIRQYCEWTGFIDYSFFIEEAAKYILLMINYGKNICRNQKKRARGNEYKHVYN